MEYISIKFGVFIYFFVIYYHPDFPLLISLCFHKGWATMRAFVLSSFICISYDIWILQSSISSWEYVIGLTLIFLLGSSFLVCNKLLFSPSILMDYY